MNANPVVAIVGVTGAVGAEFIAVMNKRNFPVGKLKALDVTPDYVQSIAARGFGDLTPDKLVEMKALGFDPRKVRKH